jgi:protein TonB
MGASAIVPTDQAVAPAHSGRLRWSALALAAGLHAVVLAALLLEPADNLAGSYGHQLDAISVTIVNSTVLQALSSADAASAPPPSAAPLETVDGSVEAASASPEAKAPPAEKAPELASAAVIADAPGEASPGAGDRQPSNASAPATKGGVTALVETGDIPTRHAPPAAASPGAVREYARYVSLSLAKTKPTGAGRSGTVKVRLEIAAGGKLAGAEVTKSSGNKKLDETALEAVRRARFPAPPAGMTAAQLTYDVPYHFR